MNFMVILLHFFKETSNVCWNGSEMMGDVGRSSLELHTASSVAHYNLLIWL